MLSCTRRRSRAVSSWRSSPTKSLRNPHSTSSVQLLCLICHPKSPPVPHNWMIGSITQSTDGRLGRKRHLDRTRKDIRTLLPAFIQATPGIIVSKSPHPTQVDPTRTRKLRTRMNPHYLTSLSHSYRITATYQATAG